MNKSSATIMAAALMLASSCTDIKQEGQGYEPIIGKQEITIKDGRLTPEVDRCYVQPGQFASDAAKSKRSNGTI